MRRASPFSRRSVARQSAAGGTAAGPRVHRRATRRERQRTAIHHRSGRRAEQLVELPRPTGGADGRFPVADEEFHIPTAIFATVLEQWHGERDSYRGFNAMGFRTKRLVHSNHTNLSRRRAKREAILLPKARAGNVSARSHSPRHAVPYVPPATRCAAHSASSSRLILALCRTSTGRAG